MFEAVGQYAETGLKAVKNMSSLQKAGLLAGGAIVIGLLFVMSSSDEEEVIPATNVEISDGDDGDTTEEAVEATVVEVAEEK